jgi:serine/threonine protein kinase
MTERALTTTRSARRSQVVRALSAEEQSLVDQLVKEMNARWEKGERVTVEDLLVEHVELQSNAEAVIELVYEELCLRERTGDQQPPERILARFPQWRDELRMLLDCHEAFHELVAEPDFPAPGESFGEFHLLSELGRGAEGRVYLASQASLADRPVVLKLIRRRSGEHLSLARAQHTHIVPLYSVAEDAEGGLKGLCMPYFGGASLGQILDSLADIPVTERTGRHVLDAIDRLQALRPVQLARGGPARRVLERATYVQAIVWIGACLAEALQFAHDRGLVHLDVKPSNVLLAADGQPMLLDFHLAQPPLMRGATNLPQLGGTAPYMAPEQDDALTAVKENRPLASKVGPPADVYALALTLYEAFGGQTGRATDQWPRLEEANRRVPLEIADVIHKCLSRDPAARYADAGRLAADLRRHLNNQPLLGVPNRSPSHRWQKWRRRRPLALYYGAALALALTVAGYAGLNWNRSAPPPTERVVELLEEGRRHAAAGQFPAATESFQTGLALVGAARQDKLAESFRNELRQTIARQASMQLREANDRLRAAVIDDDHSPADWTRIARQYRQLWVNRARLIERLRAGANGRFADDARQDLLNLALLVSEAEYRGEPARSDVLVTGTESTQPGMSVLAEAETLLGPSAVLDLQRARISGPSALSQTVAQLTAGSGGRPAEVSVWESAVIGRTLLVAGKPRDAEPWLADSVSRQPDAFWPHLYRGVCFERLGDRQAAVAEFTACIALDPSSATAFYHRGVAYEAATQPESAKDDFDRALELNPDHGGARRMLNRLKQAG